MHELKEDISLLLTGIQFINLVVHWYACIFMVSGKKLKDLYTPGKDSTARLEL